MTTAETAHPLPASEAATAVRYTIDSAHARAHFRVRHLMVAWVRGHLGTVVGDLLFDAADPARSAASAVIDATGVDTGNPERDAHLRSADFLDVERHPVVTFRSTSVAPRGQGVFDVAGELTIRGVTRAVVLQADLSGEVRDSLGTTKRGVTATTRIDRKDFGVSWNALLDAGGLTVGDQVDITIEAELVRQA
jgi:polyisoprenoid-binding protein YceI